MTTPEHPNGREAIARIIDPEAWHEQPAYRKADIRGFQRLALAKADQIIAALHEGWQIVPLEPTEEMCAALENGEVPSMADLDGTCKAIWLPSYRAMLAAAPVNWRAGP